MELLNPYSLDLTVYGLLKDLIWPYLDGFSQSSVLITSWLTNKITEVSSNIQRVDISHPVEVEVCWSDFLPQIAPIRLPIGNNPFKIELNKQFTIFKSYEKWLPSIKTKLMLYLNQRPDMSRVTLSTLVENCTPFWESHSPKCWKSTKIVFISPNN